MCPYPSRPRLRVGSLGLSVFGPRSPEERRLATYRVRQETTRDAVGAGVLACADAWAEAIADGAGAEAWLAGLVLRLRALLRARPFSATAAAEVGAALVEGHLTDPDLLARTAEVLDQHLYTLAGADDADARTRLTLAVGSLAAGFAGALRMRALAEQQHATMRLRHLAHHDPLTGLPNRALLTERINQLFRSPSPDSRVGLCFLDLDGFKRINDAYGHDFGDRLLAAVAERMNACVTAQGHLLVRMGGDEFVILVGHPRPGAAAAIADHVMAALATPFQVGDREVSVSASMGVVERPLAATGPTELLRAADITMYRAKKAGKGQWTMFDQDRGPHRLDFPVASDSVGCLGVGAAIAS
jgi:diguanylate cyclase (GGDEF)-like protein